MSARALLAVHAVLGAVSVLAVTAEAVVAVLWAARERDAGAADGRAVREIFAHRLGWVSAAAVVTQFAVGLALYPAYRVRVRALDFDRNAPLYSQLFDFKEHLAALSLALVLAAALAGRIRTGRTAAAGDHNLTGADATVAAAGGALAEARWPLAAIAATAALFVWTVAILGVFVTARHAV